MNISFEGKVALVTGAASGLGLATTKAFAHPGRPSR
jgi:NAD(P)-dependent dehydrogenase (short-subunit alcohol dehydrogenase family)